MKLITRDVDYAIQAVCYLAQQEKRLVAVTELTERLAIPRPFLRKILQILNKKNIVRSQKGKGGGFDLLIPLNQLSVFDVITAFQGQIMLNDHMINRKVCWRAKNCNLKQEFDRIEKNMILELKKVTIKKLLAKKE